MPSCIKRVLITVKAYPNPSKKYGETVCCAGVDVNTTERGRTALTIAVKSGHTEVARLLIEAGADVNAKGGFRPIIATPLEWASTYGHTDIVKLLIAEGADVNAETKPVPETTNTALLYASREGHTDIVKLLKETGAKE